MFTGTVLTWFLQGPAKRKPPFHKIEVAYERSRQLQTSGQGGKGDLNFLPFQVVPILSCASHHPLPLLWLPAAPPAPQSTSSCTPYIELLPFTCSQWPSVLSSAPSLHFTSGQGCRATWANDQQDNPVTEGASSFAKAADIWVKNLDHIQHITVSNQISCNCWLNSISMLTRLACVVEKYVYRTNQWHQISDYNALDSLKVWSMHLHFLIIKVVHMKQYFKQEQGLLFL